MGIIGKLVGGAIGFALGGPLGAVAGAMFGHAYDANQQPQALPGGQMPEGHFSDSDRAHATFFLAAFSMLAKLVASDGKIADQEMQTIDRFMVEDLGLEFDKRQFAYQVFNTAINSPQRFEAFGLQFYEQFRDQPQILELMIDILLRVAVSDGDLNPNEAAMIHNAAQIFRFSEQRYEALKSRYVSSGLQQYYDILKSRPNDSDDTIKSRYRQLVREYHPDKIEAKGLPEEFTKLATDKFREIQEAYDAVKQARGMA